VGLSGRREVLHGKRCEKAQEEDQKHKYKKLREKMRHQRRKRGH
jgi:hypothetical protein